MTPEDAARNQFPKHAQGPIVIELDREADAAGNFTAKARYTGSAAVLAEATEASNIAAVTAVLTLLAANYPGGNLTTLMPLSIVNAGVSDFYWTQ